MDTYTVFAVYADQPQRYATNVQAASAYDAECIARDEAPSDLLVAAVVLGNHRPVDVEYITTGETDALDPREAS